MPLPWKKTKVSRISRFVADFKSPSRRGGSLVVETGFPTSLVDLFVKNRDRLKKQSKKKSKLESQMEISRPVNVTSPPSSCNANTKVSSSSGEEESVGSKKIKRAPVEELVFGVGDVVGVGDAGGSNKMRVLMAILRVFLVVVLALWSKELAFGITKSAFLLLFLELVGARVLVYLRPCSKVRIVFECFAQRLKLLNFVKSKENVDASSLEKIKRFDKPTMGSSDDGASKNLFEEIEVLDRKCFAAIPVEDVRRGRWNLEVESGEKRESSLELGRTEIIVGEIRNKNEDRVCKKEQSRSAKMKAHLKKIVPKKLYKRKNKMGKEIEMDSKSEVSSCAGDSKLAEQRNRDKQEQYVDVELCQYPSVKDEKTSQGEDESSCITVEESGEVANKRNSGYIILFFFVLVGLVGGRVLALLLTVSWCLVFKLAGQLRPAKISC